MIYELQNIKFRIITWKYKHLIFLYRSQLIITSVLVSVQFMATLVWVFAAFPAAKTYFPDRDLVSKQKNQYILEINKFKELCQNSIENKTFYI